jgi:hypothetical protein
MVSENVNNPIITPVLQVYTLLPERLSFLPESSAISPNISAEVYYLWLLVK